MLVDSGILIPSDYQLDLQKTLLSIHVTVNKDFLSLHPPLWLKLFVVIELLFQLPFFFVASIDYLTRQSPQLKLWNVLYGFNASLTTLVCLIYIAFQGPSEGLTHKEVFSLLGVYFPTFIIPLAMMIDNIKRISSELTNNKSKIKSL